MKQMLADLKADGDDERQVAPPLWGNSCAVPIHSALIHCLRTLHWFVLHCPCRNCAGARHTTTLSTLKLNPSREGGLHNIIDRCIGCRR